MPTVDFSFYAHSITIVTEEQNITYGTQVLAVLPDYNGSPLEIVGTITEVRYQSFYCNGNIDVFILLHDTKRMIKIETRTLTCSTIGYDIDRRKRIESGYGTMVPDNLFIDLMLVD